MPRNRPHNYFFRFCTRCGEKFKPRGKVQFICDACDRTGKGKNTLKKKQTLIGVMPETIPMECKLCSKKLKTIEWVRCYGYYFCSLDCVNKWEDEKVKRK